MMHRFTKLMVVILVAATMFVEEMETVRQPAVGVVENGKVMHFPHNMEYKTPQPTQALLPSRLGACEIPSTNATWDSLYFDFVCHQKPFLL